MTFATAYNAATASLATATVNGPKGLRALAKENGISYRGMRKADLVAALAERIARAAIRVYRSQTATDEPAGSHTDTVDGEGVMTTKRTRNDNHTIGGSSAIVEPLWALLSSGTALINDIHALFVEHGVNVKRGTIVSRLATQRKNGNVNVAHDTDSAGRTISLISAAGGWTKEAMAVKFAKVPA